MTGPKRPVGRPRKQPDQGRSRGHRTMVYCDETPRPRWGWWCRDCQAHVPPWTTRQRTVDDDAKQHEQERGARLCAVS